MVEGDHLPRADRLRRLPEQRARLRARGREAARARGAAQGDVDADAALRAEPDPLAPRLARDVGARAGGDLDVLVLLPRARADPRPVRARHRGADAHPLLPGRRARRGHPAGLLSASAASSSSGCRTRSTSTRRSLDRNEIWLERTQGIGLLSAEDAIALGQSGPVLRASGVDWDLRRDQPYLAYDAGRLPTSPSIHDGDVYARYRVRMDEMRESTRIVAPVPRPARAHGGRAVDRGRPQGRAAAARGAPHVDGVAHPPLQDRHRGLPRARGRDLRRRSSRRAASRAATSSPTAGRSRGASSSARRRSSRSRRRRRACTTRSSPT